MNEDRHAALIEQQFTAQAEVFANSQTLHADAALALLLEAAVPKASDSMLDVACGPGSVVTAFAPHVREATGLDATEAMLAQARKLAAERGVSNARWFKGDVYALPSDDCAFDIVTCRFAVHHLERPEAAFAEMIRVVKGGGRIVLCDGLASNDPAKAAALNAFERLRDPSTIGFRTLAELRALFAGMPEPTALFYKHPGTLSRMLQNSFPEDGDIERLRSMVEQSVDTDALGLNARRFDGDIHLETPIVILSAIKHG